MAIDASASVQALSAIGTATQVSAHNIANMNTSGFKPQQVQMTSSVSGGGPQATVQTSAPGPQVTTRADTPMPKTGSIQQGSGVNVATEMANLIRNEDLYAANANVVRTSEEMAGTVLDMKV